MLLPPRKRRVAAAAVCIIRGDERTGTSRRVTAVQYSKIQSSPKTPIFANGKLLLGKMPVEIDGLTNTTIVLMVDDIRAGWSLDLH